MSKIKGSATREVKGLVDPPLPDGQVWAYDEITEMEITNTTGGTLRFITGEVVAPGKKITLGMAAYRENQPWINGQRVEKREVKRTIKRIRDLNREAEEAARAKALMERQE